jgi:hypothetical protein
MYQPDMIKDAIEVTMQIVNGNPPDWYEEGESVTQVIPAARVDAGNVEEYYDEDAPY